MAIALLFVSRIKMTYTLSSRSFSLPTRDFASLNGFVSEGGGRGRAGCGNGAFTALAAAISLFTTYESLSDVDIEMEIT